MYLFELFDDPKSELGFPRLPVFGPEAPPPFQTLVKLGIGNNAVYGYPILHWDAVCNAIIGIPNALYREVRPVIADAPDPSLATKYAIDALSNRNFFKYHALLTSAKAEYDPLSNYDMTERTTITYNGGEITSNTQTTDSITTHLESAVTDTTEYGGINRTVTAAGAADTTEYGAAEQTTTQRGGTDTTSTPAQTTTTERGAANTTTTTAAATTTEQTAHNVYGYDSASTASPDSTDIRTLTAPEQTTRQAADAVTDVTTVAALEVTSVRGGDLITAAAGEHTDTVTYGERSGTEATTAHTDTVNLGERTTRDTHRAGDITTQKAFSERSDVTELSRKGNIGVTTSQQLLKSEIDLRAATEYIDILARDIINVLTVGIYGMGGL